MTRILIVDDEPDILESTKLLLEAEGYQVDTLAEAGQVAAVLQDGHHDVLLQDVNMPGLDVAALVGAVRKSAPSRLVIFLFTANADPEVARRKSGADDVVAKPFELQKLVDRIERHRRYRTLI